MDRIDTIPQLTSALLEGWIVVGRNLPRGGLAYWLERDGQKRPASTRVVMGAQSRSILRSGGHRPDDLQVWLPTQKYAPAARTNSAKENPNVGTQ